MTSTSGVGIIPHLALLFRYDMIVHSLPSTYMKKNKSLFLEKLYKSNSLLFLAMNCSWEDDDKEPGPFGSQNHVLLLLRPCLVHLKNKKLFKIVCHIESCATCIKH